MLHLLYSFLLPKEAQIQSLFNHRSLEVHHSSHLEDLIGLRQFLLYVDRINLGLPQAVKEGTPSEVEDFPQKLRLLVQECLSWRPKTAQSFQWGQPRLILCYTTVTCLEVEQARLELHSSFPWSLNHTNAEFLELWSSQLQVQHACSLQLPFWPNWCYLLLTQLPLQFLLGPGLFQPTKAALNRKWSLWEGPAAYRRL